MEITLKEIMDLKDPFVRLSNEKLPIRFAYKLSLVIKEIDTQLAAVQAARVSLFNKLSIFDEEKKENVVPPENVDPFNKEWAELLAEVVELGFDKLKFDDLPEAALSAQDMLKLTPIFEV